MICSWKLAESTSGRCACRSCTVQAPRAAHDSTLVAARNFILSASESPRTSENLTSEHYRAVVGPERKTWVLITLSLRLHGIISVYCGTPGRPPWTAVSKDEEGRSDGYGL